MLRCWLLASTMRKFFTETDPVIPVHHPRIVLDAATAHGADRAALIAAAGLTEEALGLPETRISYAQFFAMERLALAQTKDPALGLLVGHKAQLASAGMLGIAAQSSATGAEAAELAIRYYRWLAPGWDMQIVVEGDLGRFRLEETIPHGDLKVFATEAMTVGFLRMAATVLSRPVPMHEVIFGYPAPAHAARYAEFITAPVRFGAPVTEARFDARVLAAPIGTADPAMARLAEQYCATEAARTVTVGGVIAQVKGVLSGRDGGRMDLDEVARRLQTSSRSLRRELQRAGSSYQQLLDEARQSRASEWVRHTDMRLEDISRELGFSDVRSFRRAFKRWTGQTPNALRNPAQRG